MSPSEKPPSLTPLFTRDEIALRVRALGDAINRDYAGQTLTAIGILKGSFLFLADLVRVLNIPVAIDFIQTSSYGDATESSGEVRILRDFEGSLAGRHVLLVEDIIDTGLTLNYLWDLIEARRPASVAIAAMFVKEGKQRLNHPIRYAGFALVGDPFIVGYGMDYRGLYRNLDHVAALELEETR